jgi:hypothetical protein
MIVTTGRALGHPLRQPQTETWQRIEGESADPGTSALCSGRILALVRETESFWREIAKQFVCNFNHMPGVGDAFQLGRFIPSAGRR